VSRGRSLLALWEVDERVAALRREIAALEAELREDAVLDGLRREAAAAEADRRSAELAGRAVELELAGVRQKARTLDRKLYDGSVRNPQDLLGMQRDLEAMRPRIEALEGRLLEAMERSEGAEAALGQARAAVAERERERASLEAPRRARLDAGRGELDGAVAARAAAVAAVDPADLRVYERVAARRQPPVVHLEGDACGGCHLPLAVREVREARFGESLVQCSNCDRVVVG
jgi:predicted  nucleic acid-binding Zn-ribbon protein